MRALLSLGANLGDRKAHLAAALRLLQAHPAIELRAVSWCYETEPVGGVDQPPFLNLAAEIETALAPLELLNAAKDIEERLGRVESVHWGPRDIDIDIVLCGDHIIESARLTVPHPEFRRRAFVLCPMTEIAPDAVDPVTGKTVAELAKAPEAAGQVRRVFFLATS